MSCCFTMVLVFVLLFSPTKLVLAQQTVFRLSCQRTAIFNQVGNDQKCPTGILQTGVRDTMTGCYQWCISVDKCRGANIKEESPGNIKCELVKENLASSPTCKLLVEVGWQYFAATYTYPAEVLESGTCLRRRNSRCTVEEELNPEIYIPFDALFCGNTFLFGRGHDDRGKNGMNIEGAFVEKDATLSRMVMVMAEPKWINLGNFGENRMNKPDGKSFTVSLWAKTSDQQNNRDGSHYIGCGKPEEEGFFIRQRDQGEKIVAGYAYASTLTRYYLNVKLTQRSLGWKHMAMTFVLGAPDEETAFAFYLNGTLMPSYFGTNPIENLSTSSPFLGLGELKSFSRFAYWSRVLTSEEIASIYRQL